MLALVGCDASVSLYSTTDGDEYVQTLEIRMPNAMLRDIEADAAYRTPIERWSLVGWLNMLSALVTYADGSHYEGANLVSKDGDSIITLERRFTPAPDDADEPDEDVVRTVKNNLFFYTVEVTEPNPFNGLRADYEAGTEGTIMAYIRNGIVQDNIVLLPALTEAFPRIADYDPSGLKLKLYVAFGDKVQTTGTRVSIDGVRYYLFERSFDDSAQTITYKYFRPNSLGWNIVALVVAALTVVVILLCTRKSKPRQTQEIKFNY